MKVKKKIVLHFPQALLDQPVISDLTRHYDLDFSILKARVTPEEEGVLVLELSGREANYRKALAYLKKQGITIQPLSKDIKWDHNVCTQCGACVTICPTGALCQDKKTRVVSFNRKKCVLCELCVLPCPPRAITISI